MFAFQHLSSPAVLFCVNSWPIFSPTLACQTLRGGVLPYLFTTEALVPGTVLGTNLPLIESLLMNGIQSHLCSVATTLFNDALGCWLTVLCVLYETVQRWLPCSTDIHRTPTQPSPNKQTNIGRFSTADAASPSPNMLLSSALTGISNGKLRQRVR